MRYIVLVKPPDDHPGAVRLMGPYRDHAKAVTFCERIRAKVDDDLEDDSPGFAYVVALEEPRLRAAWKWALRGE